MTGNLRAFNDNSWLELLLLGLGENAGMGYCGSFRVFINLTENKGLSGLTRLDSYNSELRTMTRSAAHATAGVEIATDAAVRHKKESATHATESHSQSSCHQGWGLGIEDRHMLARTHGTRIST